MTKKHLPVVGSTAKSTGFALTSIEGPRGLVLVLDGNQKITRGNGTFAAPVANALSLPAAAVSGIEHCPQSTETCRAACYVGPLEKSQRAVYDQYEHNARVLGQILADPELADEWVDALAGYIEHNCAGGFRWHVSGDIVSLDHARWIAEVVSLSHRVPHWIYTRSFDYLQPLMAVSATRGGNLAINLSCDQDNYAAARVAALVTDESMLNQDGDVIPCDPLRLCYLTVDGEVPGDLPSGSVIFPDYRLRPRQHATLSESNWWAGLTVDQREMVCPVDAHGKSEKLRCGPCDRCLL